METKQATKGQVKTEEMQELLAKRNSVRRQLERLDADFAEIREDYQKTRQQQTRKIDADFKEVSRVYNRERKKLKTALAAIDRHSDTLGI